MHPDDERLADIALGWDDEQDAETAEVRRHVAGCARCQATVTELGRTLQLLGAMPDVLPELRAGSVSLDQPPTSVRDSVLLATVEDALTGPASIGPASTGPASTGPAPLAAAGGDVGNPAVTPITAAPRRRLSRPVGFLLAAAAGLAVGLLAGRPLWSAEPAPTPTTVASTSLDRLDTKAPLGEASVVRIGNVIDLDVQASSPLDPGSGYLEVWLINTDGKRMVSVGVLDPSGRAVFPISADLLSRGYVIVDISREGYDARPEHSGDSVARGTLPA